MGPSVAHVGPFGAVLTTANSIQGSPAPKTRTQPYLRLGLHGSNCYSKGTFLDRNPPLLVVSAPQNGPNTPQTQVLAPSCSFCSILGCLGPGCMDGSRCAGGGGGGVDREKVNFLFYTEVQKKGQKYGKRSDFGCWSPLLDGLLGQKTLALSGQSAAKWHTITF